MATLPNRLTPQEFLEFERSSDVKHELIRGQLVAMAGGTIHHALIAANLVRALGNALHGRGCRVVGSDLRVHIPKGTFVYPDVTVACGAPEYLDNQRDTLTNPLIIVEVLSTSTSARDRGEKFELYRRILSLREYVIIAQDRAYVEHYLRDSDTSWKMTEVRGFEALLSFPSIECSVPLKEIYEHVDLPATDTLT